METPRPTPAPYRWATDFLTVGVTGTNGKTSTTSLVAAVMRAAGHGVARFTTLGYHLDAAADDDPDDDAGGPSFTELDLPKTGTGFYDALRRASELGIRHAALEVTSHALARGYAKRWRFDHAVFTNLSPDHLDEHRTWEHYLAAKAQLFVHLGPGKTAVLNASDEYALFVDKAMPADIVRCWFASPTRGPALREPDLAAREVEVSAAGTRIALQPSALAERFGGVLEVRMVGEVFAENALAAAAVCVAAGLPADAIARGLAACPSVPGRFEVLQADPAIVVDFAHTPDALARTCDTARSLAQRRLIVVMGAGGNRDREKRGPMGEETARRADLVIVTTDNPRHEDPASIAAAVAAGAERAGHAEVRKIADRRQAIVAAIAEAGPGDVVVVAGKGHETGQTIGDTTHPFSDHEVVRSVIGRADATADPSPRSC